MSLVELHTTMIDHAVNTVGEKPLVTVIVCVHNRPAQILACLDSLAESSYTALEVVVVDDASTDNTPQVIEQFAADHADGFVRLVRNATNRGVSGARNAGLDAAAGEIILFTDSDCIVESGWVAAMVDALKENNADAVCGAVRDPAPRTLVETAFFGNTSLNKSRLQSRRLVGNNMGFQRRVFDALRFDDMLTYGCDEDDVARQIVARGGKIARAPQAIVEHHHPMQLRGYLNQAKRQGQGSARYWFKYGQYLGRDILFHVFALATLPLALVDLRYLWLTVGCLVFQVAALLFNEVAFKGASLASALAVLPLVYIHNLVKTGMVLWTLTRIECGFEPQAWEARQRWRNAQKRHSNVSWPSNRNAQTAT